MGLKSGVRSSAVHDADVQAEIEQSMQAVSLDTAGARRLRVDPGTPALQAVRRYYDATRRLVELSIAVHPGERFVYVTRLRRQ